MLAFRCEHSVGAKTEDGARDVLAQEAGEFFVVLVEERVRIAGGEVNFGDGAFAAALYELLDAWEWP